MKQNLCYFLFCCILLCCEDGAPVEGEIFKVRTATIEYDWQEATINGQRVNYNVDEFFTGAGITFQDAVSKIYSKSRHKTYVDIKGVNGGVWIDNVVYGTLRALLPSEDKLFSNKEEDYAQMIRYALEHRQKTGLAYQYPYHMLSVKDCKTKKSDGYALGLAFKTAENVPASRESRSMFLFRDDIYSAGSGSNLSASYVTTWVASHEIGHSLVGITHAFGTTANQHYSGDYCVMDYYSNKWSSAGFIDDDLVFCYKQGVSCCVYLRYASFGTVGAFTD